MNQVSIETPQLKFNTVREEVRKFRGITLKTNGSHPGIQGVSGSGQINGKNINLLINLIEAVCEPLTKFIIVDARMESHGFIDDSPVTWKVSNSSANLGKTPKEILEDEQSRLDSILQNSGVGSLRVDKVSTEEQLCRAKELTYVRMPTLDHSRPSDAIVDDFIELIKKNPNAWIHVHCFAGVGRTSLFMALSYMFYNAKNLELDEILKRLVDLGGEDFMKSPSKDGLNERTRTLFSERVDFLKEFYRYCKESDPMNISWQTWLKQKTG